MKVPLGFENNPVVEAKKLLRKTSHSIMLFVLILLSYSIPYPVNAETGQCKASGISYTAEFNKYKEDLSKRFIRNLPPGLNIENDLHVKFFLQSDGYIRDVRVVSSSGSEVVDMYCLDAIYSSSPLPKPPENRGPLPPPPLNRLVPPDWYGQGVYNFRFGKTGSSSIQQASSFKYRLIPFEVQYRYPGLFTSQELLAPENELDLSLTPRQLEILRFQWARFFEQTKSPTRLEVVEKSKQIVELRSKLFIWSLEISR